jgi:uncharacterized UBP type Zn finger protein
MENIFFVYKKYKYIMIPLETTELPNSFGLENPASICYFNALLQALFTCTSFMHILGEIQDKTELVRDILKQDNSVTVLKHIRQRYPNFGNGQESATEGLVYLLDSINDENITKLFTHIYDERITCAYCARVLVSHRGNSIHFDTFDKKTFNEVGLEQYVLEYYNDIPDYNGICSNCANTSFKMCYRLKYIPEIVIFTSSKIEHHGMIIFPDTFKLIGCDGFPMYYKRIAEINHMGNIDSGHYVCTALRKHNVVMTFNDLYINVSEFKTTPDTYMSFYHYVVP